MKKYVVIWEEDVVVICKTRADAEEYVFSEIEEIAYEAFLTAAYYYGSDWTPNSYFKSKQRDLKNENEWRMTYNHPRLFENLYAYILNSNMYGWHILEVEELE